MDRAEKIQEILDEAADLSPERLEELLNRECLGDVELREEIESLLRSLAQAGCFLAAPTSHCPPPLDPGATGDVSTSAADGSLTVPIREGPGSRIGRYKLLQLIGEGGFGSVFMAEQEQPVRRKVALKIIKLGMDTRQVVARFEQERQALALMDHSNIARVLDAGETETGRPFFVMELVHGDSIVAYCDTNRLTIPDRLELFAQVCAAVQHAHTKGIIHRDIKPSNILVSTQDGRPHAKIIDFGIVKATSAPLTEKTLFTEHRTLIGTPQYMSPEQAEGSLDIDTRTDVYSLGVVLYELLTGTTPFTRKELLSAAYAEVRRIIREVDAPRPSTRLVRNADTLAHVAAQRRTQPARLGAMIRGELDWVVMRALEKDRARRYESASSLEADVRRYLNQEAVIAAPQGNVYLLRKFVLRHKGAVTAVGAVVLCLLLGVVAFAWQARVAIHRRDAAEAARAEAKQRADETQQVSEFQGQMLQQIDATAAGEQLWTDLRDRLDKALEKAGVPAANRESRTQALMHELAEINATDTAAAMIDRTILAPSLEQIGEKFKQLPAVDATLRYSVATVYQTLGLDAQALPLAAAAGRTFERIHGKDDAQAISARSLEADLLFNAGRTEEALPLARAAFDGFRRLYGADHEETLNAMSNLGNMLRSQQKFAEAEPLLKEALDRSRRVLGSSNRRTLISLNTYGFLLVAQGKPADAAPYWREAYDTGRRVFGSNDPDVLVWAANMGGLAMDLGQYEEAVARYREAAEGFRKVRGEEHPYTLDCLVCLSDALRRWGGGGGSRSEAATKVLQEVLSIQRRALGPEHPSSLNTQARVGKLLHDQGELAEAEATIREALEASRRIGGLENPETLDAMGMLAETLSDQEKYTESNTLYLECLSATERAVGREHSKYLNLATKYAASLVAQGGADRFAEAAASLQDVVQIRRRVSGTDHPGTIQARLRLGLALTAQGDLQQAEPLIVEALAAYRRLYVCDHPETAWALCSLGDLRMKQGRAAEAEPLLTEALDTQRRLFRPDHPSVAKVEAALVSCRAAIEK